jgi:2-polyprenyl-3-methyl-5-hydroxy-6-metoxy-1,4-benzoquinol methylase
MEKIVISDHKLDVESWMSMQSDRRRQIDHLFENVLPNALVHNNEAQALSIGCGIGREVYHLEKLGYNVTASDTSSSALKEGIRLGNISPKTKLIEDDFRKALVKKYDLIMALHILRSIPVKEAVSSAISSLNENGTLIVSGGDEVINEFEDFFNSGSEEFPEIKVMQMLIDPSCEDRRLLIIQK